MEAQAQSLKQLEQKLDRKCQVECRGAIESLLPEQRNAIQDGLVELVIKGTPNQQNTRSLGNCLDFFPHEEIFKFLQRIRTGELLQPFCMFFLIIYQNIRL